MRWPGGATRRDGAANTLTEAENAKIVAFLKTLTGDQPSFMVPVLPPSTDKTPRPTPFAKK